MSTIFTKGMQSITVRQAIWTDEFNWTPVAQKVTRTLDGSTIIEVLPGSAGGQPMTLALEWIKKYQLDILKAWRDAADQSPFAIVLDDGRAFLGVWRHHEGAPLEAEPIIERLSYEEDDDFNVVAKMMIVEA